MSHRKFCAVALAAVGALALTALGVSPASAAGAGAGGRDQLPPARDDARPHDRGADDGAVRMAEVDGRGPWPVLYL